MIGVLRFQLGGAGETFGRLRLVAQAATGVAQTAEVARRLRLQPGGVAQPVHGFRVAIRLVQNHAEQKAKLRIRRIFRQQRPAQRLGGGGAAGVMLGKSPLQGLFKGAHRNPVGAKSIFAAAGNENHLCPAA